MSGLAGELRTILRAVVWVAAILALALVIGWVCELVRFAAAQLPAIDGADTLSVWQLIAHGALWTLEAVVAGAIAGVVAWLAAKHRWNDHRTAWHAVVHPGTAAGQPRPVVDPATAAGQPHPPASPAAPATGFRPHPDEWAVQVVAGFNILLVAGLLALGVNRLASWFVTKLLHSGATWIAVALGGLVLVGTWVALTHLGPLRWRAAHVAVWVLVALASLFASAPVGVLLLTGAILAGCGRALSHLPRPTSLTGLARSRLLWALLGIAVLLGVAYNAMGPVGFPRVVVATASGELTGGFVARGGAGVDIVTCTALADATSTDARLQLVGANTVHAVQIGGGSSYFDSGSRPSLARLALHGLGIDANPPTLFTAALRATRPTCAGTGPLATSPGVADPGLGPGVVAGPSPAAPRAADGEAPIGPDTYLNAAMVALARRYQPTVLVTAADRNWPVSVNAVLAERGPTGAHVCLVVPATKQQTCPPKPTDLTPPTGYLQLPAALGNHDSPDVQLRALLAGLGAGLAPRRQWLADPSSLNPWPSAELYFYYSPRLSQAAWQHAHVTPPAFGLVGLEYWFFYAFNYYPVVADAGLMNQAPIAGDQLNVDLHQGDWEHADVLLDPSTMKPQWLYLARHDSEGVFVAWNSPTMEFDHGHPVIQAAFGGHPSYLPGCGPGPRTIARDFLVDWLSCGSGRFAFRATDTPLVDVQSQPWACWPGYFGENGRLQAAAPHSDLVIAARHTRYATPPRGPLVQAENTGVCRTGQPTSVP